MFKQTRVVSTREQVWKEGIREKYFKVKDRLFSTNLATFHLPSVCKGSIRTSNGWDHVTRGPVRSSSSPDLSRPGSARATRGPLATYKTRTKLGLLSAVLRCLPYAVPLTSSDTAPVPARLGSVRPTNSQPAQAAFNPQMGCSGTLLPEKANGYKVLVGP